MFRLLLTVAIVIGCYAVANAATHSITLPGGYKFSYSKTETTTTTTRPQEKKWSEHDYRSGTRSFFYRRPAGVPLMSQERDYPNWTPPPPKPRNSRRSWLNPLGL